MILPDRHVLAVGGFPRISPTENTAALLRKDAGGTVPISRHGVSSRVPVATDRPADNSVRSASRT